MKKDSGQPLDLHARIVSVDDFGALYEALVEAFGPHARVWHRDPGFFVILDVDARVVGSLEFKGSEWHLRWPGTASPNRRQRVK